MTALALALALPSLAQAETLADAVADAYQRNPGLVEQRYLQRARDETYVQARAQYGPQINVQTDGQYTHIDQGALNEGGSSGRALVTASQELYSSGRIRGQVDAARADIRSGQERLRYAEQQTIRNVILAYAGVLRDQARLEVGEQNVAVLRGQLDQKVKRQEVGDVTLTDVAQSQARLAAAEIQLASLSASLATSRGQYLVTVGHNPGMLEPLPRLGTLPGTIEQAFDQAEATNPTLVAAQYDEQASSASVAATRGEAGPTVSVSAQGIYSNDLFHFNGGGRKEAIAGFTVTQPILSGGAVRSRIRQAVARDNAAQAGIDIARRDALQDVAAAWSQLGAARIGLEAGERRVAAAQQAFAGMSCEELNGLRSTIETLNAEQELQSAQLDLLSARYQLYQSHASLLAAMGVLSAQSIADNAGTYDPEANFRRIKFSGVTPLDLIAAGLDRIGSASPRGKLSAELTGANVSEPEPQAALPPAPDPAQVHKPLVPITESQLTLADGTALHCPLSTPVRNR